MNPLAIFNPDNDMALADFKPGFTPPANIRQMVDELALFPMSWLDDDTPFAILNTQTGRATVFAHGTRREVSSYAQLLTLLPETIGARKIDVAPWGWSPALCHHLTKFGLPPSLLPSKDTLARLRRLSSRQTAVDLLQRMTADLSPTLPIVGASVMCHTEEEVAEAINTWDRTILKAPWSSSGKGIRYGHLGPSDALMGWVRRILKAQQGVVVEPLYDKVHDLAMEFYSDGLGHVSYQGLSLFSTHSTGAYRGNLILPENEKEAWLLQFISPHTFNTVRQWLETSLAQVAASTYRGFLGVDMILVAMPQSQASPVQDTRPASLPSSSASFLLHPLIEVNWRMTMGMVSILLAQKKPTPKGELILDFAPGASLPEDASLLCGGSSYRVYILPI